MKVKAPDTPDCYFYKKTAFLSEVSLLLNILNKYHEKSCLIDH